MRTFIGEITQAVHETELGGLIGIVHRREKRGSDSNREPYLATRYILGLLDSKLLEIEGQDVVISCKAAVDSAKSSPLDAVDADLITEKMRDRYRLRGVVLERVFEEDFGKGLTHPIWTNELYDEDPAFYHTIHSAVEVVYGERLESSGALKYARGKEELAAFFANSVSLS